VFHRKHGALFLHRKFSAPSLIASASAKVDDNYNEEWKVITKGIGGNIGFSIAF
jgi:hypothetical protein